MHSVMRSPRAAKFELVCRLRPEPKTHSHPSIAPKAVVAPLLGDLTEYESAGSLDAQMPTIAALSALANESRLKVLRVLTEAGAEGIPAGQIGRRLGLGKKILSLHLRQLRLTGLVTFRREGRAFIYSVERSALGSLLTFLSENCCLKS